MGTITTGLLSSTYTRPSRTTVTMMHGLLTSRSAYRTAATGVSTRIEGKLGARFTTHKRPEGPGFEDELILLDLL